MVTESDCLSEFQTDWALSAYITWITLSIYVVPITALISVYTRICLAVWRSERFNRAVSGAPRSSSAATMHSSAENPRSRGERTPRDSPQTSMTTVSAAKLKTVKLTLVVVVSYIVCYGPWFVVQMWAAWDAHAPFEGIRYIVYSTRQNRPIREINAVFLQHSTKLALQALYMLR